MSVFDATVPILLNTLQGIMPILFHPMYSVLKYGKLTCLELLSIWKNNEPLWSVHSHLVFCYGWCPSIDIWNFWSAVFLFVGFLLVSLHSFYIQLVHVLLGMPPLLGSGGFLCHLPFPFTPYLLMSVMVQTSLGLLDDTT